MILLATIQLNAIDDGDGGREGGGGGRQITKTERGP